MVSALQQRATARRLILLGPPGAGKGTQAKMVLEGIPGAVHIASGDLFRYHRREGTPLGLKAAEYMSQGLLVPDEITITMVLERIQPPLTSQGFLLDGFPRNLLQARALDEALEARGLRIDKVIHIIVPTEELVRRLSGRLICRQCQVPYHLDNAPPKQEGTCDRCGGELYQRDDDTTEAVKVRIQVYQDETRPLVEYYRLVEKLVDVDGIGTVEEVGQRLTGALKT